MRFAAIVAALALCAVADARLLQDAAFSGPRTAAAAPYHYAEVVAASADAGSDLPAPAVGGKQNAEGTALPGFASAGVASKAGKAAPAPVPVPMTTETHNNGGSGLPEGTALPGFGSTGGASVASAATAGPGPATPAAAVDTTLPRTADPAPPSAAPQPELKTASVSP